MAVETPMAESLADLLDEREISMRELARICDRDYGWGSPTWLSKIMAGDYDPSLEGMEILAKALHVKPQIWPEYRMAAWRHKLNPRRVGYESAYGTLRGLEK